MSLFFVLKAKLKRRQGWAFFNVLGKSTSCPPKQAAKECDVVVMMESAVMFGFSLKCSVSMHLFSHFLGVELSPLYGISLPHYKMSIAQVTRFTIKAQRSTTFSLTVSFPS